ncbi:hypothetical protein KPZU09_09850 [Klebsiella pneumoniae]|uniref:Putrescine transport ATP-binding protein PotA n=1 Tax=Klebsiella pneumoniae TaxID=573 RepID=A0A919HMJ1_KLEPN|nr:hypothetical protein KPZU09_09850 [Klebsiella pneumoniae]
MLLLDEPLGALDLKLREQMQVELKKLQQSLGITFIFVTHDQSEALSMSDRVAVFNNGRIEQVDAPQDLYLHPVTAFVAGFVGTANVLQPRRPDDWWGWRAAGRCVRSMPAGRRRGAGAGVVQAVQYQGRRRGSSSASRMATNCWSAANIEAAAASVPRTGEIVQASWSRFGDDPAGKRRLR